MNLKIFTDGGSRGNPGISGYGFAVYDDKDNILYKESKFLGIKTNNEAEYFGVIAALNWLVEHQEKYRPESVHFYSDSQLLVRQIRGQYKVKAPNLIRLHQAVKDLLSQAKSGCSFSDIRRGCNQLADSLANKAMDHRL